MGTERLLLCTPPDHTTQQFAVTSSKSALGEWCMGRGFPDFVFKQRSKGVHGRKP